MSLKKSTDTGYARIQKNLVSYRITIGTCIHFCSSKWSKQDVDYLFEFEKNDKIPFQSKNYSEQSSVYTRDCYAIKNKDFKTLIIATYIKQIFKKIKIVKP